MYSALLTVVMIKAKSDLVPISIVKYVRTSSRLSIFNFINLSIEK